MQEVVMPNVIVIPPEEELEENPPWCYFDAADAAQEARSTSPDLDALDTALNFHQQVDNRVPAFHRALQNDSQETVVLPRKGSIAQIKEDILDGEGGSRRRQKLVDEEIVEVFKVRRNEGKEDVDEVKAPKMTKSKTFRVRAAEAFKSIKNVGKSGRRPIASSSGNSLTSSGENVQYSDDFQEHGALPRPSTPNLSRRRSLVLSQLFTFSHSSRPISPEADASTLSSSHPAAALPHRHSFQTMPSIVSPSKSHARRLHPSPSFEDYAGVPQDAGSRSTSPTPTISKRRSFRRRISVLELQKLFAVNTSPPTSSQDSRAPHVPDIFAASGSDPYSVGSPDSENMSSSSTSSYDLISVGSFPSETDLRESDGDSMEMRLDSLQFDSLHFDPDEF